MPGFRSEGFGQSLFSCREDRWRSYLASIALGKSEALTLLYDESAAALLGLALKMVKNEADAEEVILDVYEQVWRTARSFDPARASVWRWLTVLVKSRAVDRLRSAGARHNHGRLSLADDYELVSRELTPDYRTMLNQECILVRSALRMLPNDQRRALELAYFSGLTHVEIAAELGVPVGTIKTRIRSGMEKLRTSLSHVGLSATAESTQ
jgi:RNA polymerase sigma-70 factor (ECF subfamily)